jgi:transcriptional regulator with XRE-family HTH domain
MRNRPANILKLKRVTLGLSQTALAQKLGTTHTLVSMWETGKAWPGPDLIPKLAKVFNMKPEAFARELDTRRRELVTA